MASDTKVLPGSAHPLGAAVTDGGTNFAVFSAVASAVTLCLFDDAGTEVQVPLPEVDSFVWHGFVPGVGAGQRYGYRVDGPWNLAGEPRCNPHKLLVDPYALAIEGDVDWGHGAADEPLFDYLWDDHRRSSIDSAPLMPRCVVVDRSFDWQGESFSRPALADTVIYECHVKGATQTLDDLPEALRGTFAGLAHPAFVDHLHRLGVTSVELMPVHHFLSEQDLVAAGRSDYWGYNTIGFFAPHHAYSSTGDGGQQVREFKEMVRQLHAAGLEVILDVVFNHTAEGGQLGASLSFRGLDNGSYYPILPGGAVLDLAGTGNSTNLWDPAMLRLVLDSLRYWVTDMHVDGFRFDLATVLSQTDPSRSVSVFMDLVYQDPVISTVKLIAEPWNGVGSNYGLGRFPSNWSEWNDRFRINVRRIWKSDPGLRGAFKELFEGSPSTFDPATGTKPSASVNYVAAHDGYTLRDVVSYNNPGPNDQQAWDSGGPADSTDSRVAAVRSSRQRAMLATVAFAQGLPMIGHGDELGRTQGGNPNAYDQDNATTWIDWSSADGDLVAFTGRVLALRAAHPVFRQHRWLTASGSGLDWYTPGGAPMGDADWDSAESVTMTVRLSGDAIGGVGADGAPVTDDDFLILLNAWADPLDMVVPADLGGRWTAVVDASQPTGIPLSASPTTAGTAVTVGPRSLVVLTRPRPGAAEHPSGPQDG